MQIRGKSKALAIFLSAILLLGTLFFAAPQTAQAAEPTWGATVTVGPLSCDYTDLQNAITAAGTPPTIIALMADASTSATISINSGQTIKLTSGTGGPFAIDANGGDFSVITNSGELWLEDIVITGADKSGSGGGVYNSGTLVLQEGGEISANTANDTSTYTDNCGGGGGVYNDNGTFIMTGGAISDNLAHNTTTYSYHGGGGGVYCKGGTFTMTGGVISGNLVANATTNGENFGGGGVNVYNAEFTMSGGEISDNEAVWGGGVYNFSTEITGHAADAFTMSGSAVISDNVARYGAGVLNLGTVKLEDGASISGNHATYLNPPGGGHGGGIYNCGEVTMEDGVALNGNDATSGAGAYNTGSVFVAGAQRLAVFTMNGGEICNNKTTTTGLGGGVTQVVSTFTSADSKFFMNGGKISNNVSSTGGGVYNYNSTFIMSGDAEISDNEAGSGGGIYNYTAWLDTSTTGVSTVIMEGAAVISGNKATTGGGAYNYSEALFNMRDAAAISGNEANNGGGVFNSGSVYNNRTYRATFNMENDAEISRNTASVGGGGVYNYYETVFNMRDTARICLNTANNNGGGVFNAGYTFTISGTPTYLPGVLNMYDGAITDNKTIVGNGGGVYSSSTVAMIDGEISDNSAANNGGGIFTVNYSDLTVGAPATFSGNSAATVSIDRDPAQDAIYGTNILATNWTSPLTQGYNNYDINHDYQPKCLVTFMRNDGTGDIYDTRLLDTFPAALGTDMPDAPEFTNNTFEGWNTKPDGSGDDFDDSTLVSRSITVYAQWQAKGGVYPVNPDPPVPTNPFIEEHVAYIIGYPQGDVRPERDITRAEAATVFFRLLTDEVRAKNWTRQNAFPDVDVGEWFNNAISVMSNMGTVNGYPDGTFRPDSAISRAELAAIAARFARAMGMTPINSPSFSDISGHWAEGDIIFAAEIGWVNGYPDNTYRPDQNITRAEFMTLVNRMLGRVPETEDDLLSAGMKQWTDNADPSAWYYLAVQEATNSHVPEYKEKPVPGLSFKYEYWVKMLPNRDWAQLEKEWAEPFAE